MGAFDAIDFSAQEIAAAIGSGVTGGGGPGNVPGAVPTNAALWADSIGRAAGVYFQYKTADKEYQKAKLENRNLNLAANLYGFNSEALQPGGGATLPMGQQQRASGGLSLEPLLLIVAVVWIMKG